MSYYWIGDKCYKMPEQSLTPPEPGKNQIEAYCEKCGVDILDDEEVIVIESFDYCLSCYNYLAYFKRIATCPCCSTLIFVEDLEAPEAK